jgi:hypothetical protein
VVFPGRMSFHTRVVGPLRRDRRTSPTAFYRNLPVSTPAGLPEGCGLRSRHRQGLTDEPVSAVEDRHPLFPTAVPTRPADCVTWRIRVLSETAAAAAYRVCATWRACRPRRDRPRLRHLTHPRPAGRHPTLRHLTRLCGADAVPGGHHVSGRYRDTHLCRNRFHDTRHAQSARFRSEFSSSPCRHPPHLGGTT